MVAKRILVVEDSAIDRRLIVDALKNQGFSIDVAEDGEQALGAVAQQRPDLIVLDIVLPKKNGYQVCRQLKSAAETKSIKILMVSSKTQESDRFWGMKQGADAYLTKPFQDSELVDWVGKLI